jgi:hypothetical protein
MSAAQQWPDFGIASQSHPSSLRHSFDLSDCLRRVSDWLLKTASCCLSFRELDTALMQSCGIGILHIIFILFFSVWSSITAFFSLR